MKPFQNQPQHHARAGDAGATEEVASLKFALAELQKAVNAMDPESQFEMTSVNDPAKSPAASQRAGAKRSDNIIYYAAIDAQRRAGGGGGLS